jgi:hypothetical protein
MSPSEAPPSTIPPASQSGGPPEEGRGPRADRGSMTLIDLMALVAGMAVGFTLVSAVMAMPRPMRVVQVGGGAALFHTLSSRPTTPLLLNLAMGAAAVVLSRLARTGDVPRPAEWLAILLALSLVEMAFPRPQLDSERPEGETVAVDFYGKGVPNYLYVYDYTRGSLRGVLGGVAAVVVGVALGLVALVAALGPRLTPAFRAILLALAALLVLWGPCRWVEMVFPAETRFSFFPTKPPGDFPLRSRWSFDVGNEARAALGRWPRGLLFAIPVVALVGDLWRKGLWRRWTEWVGMVVALILGGQWLAGELVYRPAPGLDVMGPAVAGWLVAIGFPAWLIVRFGGPAWERRVGSPLARAGGDS